MFRRKRKQLHLGRQRAIDIASHGGNCRISSYPEQDENGVLKQWVYYGAHGYFEEYESLSAHGCC